MTKYQAEFKGRDLICLEVSEANQTEMSVIGCTDLMALVRRYQVQFGENINLWPFPEGDGHADLLLKEVILKYKKIWNYPYLESEICHCRSVTTEAVDESILAGAHSPSDVSRLTGASTACGTCRPDVEKIIAYRLKKDF